MRRGTEPVNARSALQLRRVLAWSALVVFLAAAALLGLAAAAAGDGDAPSRTARALLAAVCALVAATAAVDLLVIRKRRAQERERH